MNISLFIPLHEQVGALSVHNPLYMLSMIHYPGRGINIPYSHGNDLHDNVEEQMGEKAPDRRRMSKDAKLLCTKFLRKVHSTCNAIKTIEMMIPMASGPVPLPQTIKDQVVFVNHCESFRSGRCL